MAKKKGLDLGLILSGVAALLGLVAVCMLFAPAVGIKDSETTYTGMNVVFGYSEKVLTKDVEIFTFSFMNLLTYVLALAGIVFAVLAALGKLGVISKIVSAACFVVAGIMFFCAVVFSALGEGADAVLTIGSVLSGGKENAKDMLTLAFGAILGGILSILAGAAVAVPMFLKK